MSAEFGSASAAAKSPSEQSNWLFGSLRYQYSAAKQTSLSQRAESVVGREERDTVGSADGGTSVPDRHDGLLPTRPSSSTSQQDPSEAVGYLCSSTLPTSSVTHVSTPLNPCASSFDLLSLSTLSIQATSSGQSEDGRSLLNPNNTSSSHSSDPRLTYGSLDIHLSPPPVGPGAEAQRSGENVFNTRLEYLRSLRAQPPQGQWRDPYFIFARLGKMEKMSALVVTANKHMTQSLISESLADRMFKARDGWKEGWKKKDDRWILIDLSWPFDAASQTLRDDGSLVCFESKRVRFLIVPHREMKKGIILAKDVLEDQRLRVTKGSHQTYLGADGKREEGVLLHGFQVNILNAAASDRPFERLCRLAEFAATRKPKKNENLLFRQQIQDEVRRNHLQIR